MIEILISYFNTRIDGLKYFAERISLCELIREDGEETKSFPAQYTGEGEYKQVSDFDFSDGVCYWRKNGDVGESESDMEIGCTTVFERTIPLKLICIKSKSLNDNAYLSDNIVEDIRGVIEGKSVRAIKSIMNAIKVDVNFVSSNTNALDVYGGEYDNIEGQINYRTAYFSIDIEVVITATTDCFQTICNVTVESFLCRLIASNKAADIDACLISTGKKDAVCGAFAKAKVFYSDGTTLVIELDSGQTYTIIKHNIILPDGVTNLESKEFDEDTQLVRAYNRAALTGQFTQRRVGDDVWHRDNGTYTYITFGIRPLLHATDQTKLAAIPGNENAFGNFERYTDDSGGSSWGANNYKIDHYTGYAMTFGMQNLLNTWNTQIDWADGLSHNGFSDWRLPNANEIMTFVNVEATTRWLLSIVDLTSSQTYATSSSESGSTHYGVGNHTKQIVGITGNMVAFAIRDHY